jgi:hypothetical protein
MRNHPGYVHIIYNLRPGPNYILNVSKQMKSRGNNFE